MKPISVEKALQDWQNNLTVIGRNLTALTEAEFVKRIKNRAKGLLQPAYEAETLDQAQAALRALEGLGDDYLMLGRVIEDAWVLFRKNGMFHNYDEEIIELLEGPSIKLPTVKVPLPARELLSEAESNSSTTPAQVLSAMKVAFANARDILTRIDGVETEAQDRLYALQQEVDALQRWAQTLGVELPVQLSRPQLTHIEANPLKEAVQLEQLEREINTWRTQLEAAERDVRQTSEQLTRAESALKELEDLVNRSHLAIEESRTTFAGNLSFVEPTPAEVLTSCRAWLATLTETLQARRWKAAQVGLTRFEENMAARLTVERRAYAQNRAALDELVDLKGRFKALKVKAQALAARGVMPAQTLEALQQKAEEALAQKPVSLVDVKNMVTVFETALKV